MKFSLLGGQLVEFPLASETAGETASEGMQEDEAEMFSDVSSMSGEDTFPDEDLYSLGEIENFLKVTKGKKNIKLNTFFPDNKKFLRSVRRVQKTTDLKVLTPKKRFRLKKWVTMASKDLSELI